MKIKIAGVKNGKKVFDCEGVRKLVDWLEKDGYSMEVLDDGVLGMGTFIMWSPDPENHYSFIVREIPLNCWSSGHTIGRFSKVTKKLQAEIDAARARLESEEMEA